MLNIISVCAISAKIMNGNYWWTDQLTDTQTAAKQNALHSSKWFIKSTNHLYGNQCMNFKQDSSSEHTHCKWIDSIN